MAPVRGQMHDGLERAERSQFTRPVPRSARAQMRFCFLRRKALRRLRRPVSASPGAQSSGYRQGALRKPHKALREALVEAATSQWQPQVRARTRAHAVSSGGLVISGRARFGFSAAADSSDDPRERSITTAVALTYAAEILAARGRGATEEELHSVVAQAIGESYFRQGGNHAHGLDVVFTDVVYIDFGF